MTQQGQAILSHPVSTTSLGASGQPESRGDAGGPEVSSQAAPPPAQQLATAAPPVVRPLRLPPPPPNGRPPLPRGAPPSSATSSRASSPRSAVSAQPSLQTLNMARLAQYRAASRTFKPDAQPRKGLSTGDVVALRAHGKLLAVTELSSDPAEASTVHFGLQPSEQADASDKHTHLEVIRQGKWVGFRSAAAGDRFLQARKRSPNRLVFFSQNVGTWEQWEVAAGAPDPDACDWSALSLALRHRRLPQFELAVEVVRVGTYTLPPNAALTPRTLLPAADALGGAAALAGDAGADEEPGLERRELKRMSGVLVHEWLHYVDQEKAARLAIEARLAQMAEDAAGLRDWAVMQVDSVRREMGEEVEALLEAVRRKSAKLADAEVRLTGRLRWGVAMIQAKSEMGIKRQTFMWWRWIAARRRYCRHVESKLAQRSDLRLLGRAVQGWAQWREAQAAVQARLRAAVRRMYLVKLHHAFAAWRNLVACKRQQQEDQAALVEAVCQHVQRWRLRRLLRAWQQHAAGCGAGRQLLERMACAAQRREVASAFAAWSAHTARQRERLAAFCSSAATRRAQRAQRGAFHAWRLQVEDERGACLQLQHARQVLARRRLHAALRGWQDWRRQRADRRARWDATIAYMVQRGAALRLDAALAAWQEHVAQQKERRAVFYNAVQHLALHRMALALRGWQYVAAWHQHVRAAVETAVARVSRRALAQAWAAWQERVTEHRVARHRIAVCQRRRQLGLQRGVVGAWRHAAALAGAERQIVQLCQKRADRNRVALALAALQAHAAEAAARRERGQLAVSWYAEALQARALAAMGEAVARRRRFEQQLVAVARSVQLGQAREAFAGWRAAAALSTSKGQLVAAARRRFARMSLASRFSAWRAAVERRRAGQARLQRHSRHRAARALQAAFGAWQQQAEQSVAERQLVAAAQRRIARIRLAAALSGWRQHSADLAAARQAAAQRGAARGTALLQGCLLAWAGHAAQRARQQAGMAQLVEQRAAWLTLNVAHSWRAYAQHRRQRRAQLHHAVRKLAGVCQRHAFAAWRQEAAWRRAEAARLAALERRVARRSAALGLAAAFRGWRSHAGALASARAVVDAKVAAEGGVVRRHVLAAWRSASEAQAARHAHILRVCVARRCASLQSRGLVTWLLFAQRQAHNREAVEVMVHRMARRLMHAALLTWRQAAQERRVRRIAMARFIQRWDAQRKGAALSHWRRLLAEKREAADGLRRCLTRKRVAFRLFRQWYWESFDEDMQDTLRTMFEITEGAALDPLPSRAGSPYGSLLSSPIRQQLYGMPRQQQLQLSAGVAEALARPGAMQPAFMRSSTEGQQHSEGGGGGAFGGAYSGGSLGYGGSLALPQLPPREPLSSRLAAAAAAHGSEGSAGGAAAPQPAGLGGAPLAPLREYAAWALHGNAMLEPVPEVAESPYQARSHGGAASSAASTALPGSPLTPASAFAAGGSPLPGSGAAAQQLSPGGLSAAATPGPGGLSPLAAAATPTYSLGSAAGSQAGSARRSPLSLAGTPQPDFGLGGGEGWGGSPSSGAHLAHAPTPLGLQGRYEIRQFSAGTDYLAPAAPAAYSTPLAAQKTPPPGLAELQGDYSIQRLHAAAEEDGRHLAAQATPPHPDAAYASLIAAYPGSLSAAKTPLLHINPLAM